MSPGSDRLTASLGSPGPQQSPPKPLVTPHCPELHVGFHLLGLIPKDRSKGFTFLLCPFCSREELEAIRVYWNQSVQRAGTWNGGVTPGLWGEEEKIQRGFSSVL